MRKTTLYVLLLVAGCTKEANTYKTTADANTQNAITSFTYLPLTEGTYWNYINKTGNESADYKLTVLGLQKNINKKKYMAVKAVTGKNADTIYYNQTDNDYYVYTAGTDEDEDVDLEILYLKDDLKVGDKWSAKAGSADGVSLKCDGKIIEKNISIKVSGITYDKVIHTYVEIKKPLFLFSILLYKQDYYVAKNIGIIKTVSTQLLPVQSTTVTNITDYDIQ